MDTLADIRSTAVGRQVHGITNQNGYSLANACEVSRLALANTFSGHGPVLDAQRSEQQLHRLHRHCALVSHGAVSTMSLADAGRCHWSETIGQLKSM